MDIDHLRELFPVTGNCVYLNSAAEAPLNERSRIRLEQYLTHMSLEPHNKPGGRSRIRHRLSELLGGNPDEYALVSSTGIGLGIVAAGINWAPGDNVVVPLDEHWNNTYPWLNLARKGVEVRSVAPDEYFRITPASIAEHVDERTRVVAIAAVRFNSGFRADLKKIARIAHSHGAIFVVDGIQAAGAVPLNVDSDDIDVLACGGFKWLQGLPGTGFLYINRRVQSMINPVLPGMFAAENDLRALNLWPDARRYETGSLAYPLFHAWESGLELLQEVGVTAIHDHIIALTDRLVAGLMDRGLALLTPVANRDERSGIVVFSAGSPDNNDALFEKLRQERIIVTLRANALRVSPGLFNVASDVDALLKNLS